MVMYNMWPRTASDPKIGSDFPMSGEGTDLGLPAPALAGYLGKTPDTCPWCADRGHVHILRSYRVSHRESVTLCPNPQCLFPLVSKPLEDVLALCTTRWKRKTPTSPKGGHSEPPQKYPRSHYAAPLESQLQGEGLNEYLESAGCDGELQEEMELGAGMGELVPDFQLEEENETEPMAHRPDEGLREEAGPVGELVCELRKVTEAESTAQVDKPELELGLGEEPEAQVETPAETMDESEPHVGLREESETEVEPGAGMVNNLEQMLGLSEDSGLGERLVQESRPALGACLEEELTVAPPHLFWKNEQNLCWLDCLLVALVHCQALREHRARLLDGASVVGKLLASYDQVGLFVKAREQTDQQVVRIPAAVLEQAETDLDDLRVSIFKLLQPKLQCKLGEYETPVFALPLLLRLDTGAEDLFQHAFEWVFDCTACGHTFSNRCEKTITTFTHVLPDWHPLNAVHQASCSHCHHKRQQRKLVLERVAPVFVLHFVEGLPQRDVCKYAFDFQGKHYEVRIVIQYSQHMRHFVTWLRTSDGLWLEFDDLKHPQCTANKELPVPADQIHVVFWEVQGQAENDHASMQHNHMLPSLHVTDIVSALTVNTTNMGVESQDTSIGEATLQDAFQGLSHDDIITLTLVEVKVDAQGNPLENLSGPEGPSLPAAELGPPSTNSAADAILNSHVSESPQKRGPKPKEKKALQASEAALSVPRSSAIVAPTFCSSASTARWSNLLSRHLFHQASPLNLRQTTTPSPPKTPQKVTDSNFPAKAADMFSGFTSIKQTQDGSPACNGVELKTQKDVFKLPAPPKSPGITGGTVLPKTSHKLNQGLKSLNGMDTLRYKLLKKLKAKKKKLAVLNQLLKMGVGSPSPKSDHSGLTSPSIVSSSTSVHHSPAYDELLADLLSPATTASSHSPDSTSLLEMPAGRKDGDVHSACNSLSQKPLGVGPMVVGTTLPESTGNGIASTEDDFLDEFMSSSYVTESPDLDTFDLFF